MWDVAGGDYLDRFSSEDVVRNVVGSVGEVKVVEISVKEEILNFSYYYYCKSPNVNKIKL